MIQAAIIILPVALLAALFAVLFRPIKIKHTFESMNNHWRAYGWYIDSNNRSRNDVDGLIDAWLQHQAEEHDCSVREILDTIKIRRRRRKHETKV